MATQNIDATFIGTSDPVSFQHTLSYYGPAMIDSKDTTIGASEVLLDSSKKVGPVKASAEITWNWTAGFSFPAWAANIAVDQGEITENSMSLDMHRNTLMGGCFLGLIIGVHFSFRTDLWYPGHPGHDGWRPKWVSGHWSNQINKSETMHYDVLALGFNFIWSMRTKVPAFKKLVMLLPQNLLDGMQDYENDKLANSGEVPLKIKIPVKWDLIYICRQIAELGVDVGSNAFTPAVAAAVTAATEVGEAMIAFEEEVGMSLGCGPEINLVFPIDIKMTELVADNVVFRELSFDDGTVTATNPDGTPDVGNIERIGIQFEQSLNFMTVEIGLWTKLTFAKVFSKGASRDIDIVEALEDAIGIELKMASYRSRMTNDIGAPGIDPDDPAGQPPESVEFVFI